MNLHLHATVFNFLQAPKDKAELSVVNIFKVLLLTRKLDTYFQENMSANTNTLQICPCIVVANTRILINTTQTSGEIEKTDG